MLPLAQTGQAGVDGLSIPSLLCRVEKVMADGRAGVGMAPLLGVCEVGDGGASQGHREPFPQLAV